MKKKMSIRMIVLTMAGILLLAIVLPYLRRPEMDLPGTDCASPYCAIDPQQCELLIDSTTFDPERGERIIEQGIFDRILSLIDAADSFIVADFFLLNPWKGSVPENHRALSSELAQALIDKKRSRPEIEIILLTDPINRIYGSDEPEIYARMAAAGIAIVFTDVDRLPPSNLLYSPIADSYSRLLEKVAPIEKRLAARVVPNPFESGGRPISIRQLLRLLNFRANHRKLIVSDRPDGSLRLLTCSFNPADGSSAHSNIGIVAAGPVARHALISELDCIAWSAADPRNCLPADAEVLERALAHCRRFAEAPDGEPAPGDPRAQWLTERAIRRKLLEMLDNAEAEDEIDIALFYFSDRALVKSVARAAERGARVRIILDANKDAFGRQKNGIPNRVVAAELCRGGDPGSRPRIRWALTHGEQFHSKAISVRSRDGGKAQFLCGSANWTRRNIQNLNLEAVFYIENANDIVHDYRAYFDSAWGNECAGLATAEYGRYAIDGWELLWKKWLYFLQEKIGASTF